MFSFHQPLQRASAPEVHHRLRLHTVSSRCRSERIDVAPTPTLRVVLFSRSPRRLSLLVLLALMVAVGFGIAVEQRFGEQLASVSEDAPPRDPSGRRLYILMVDSLTIDDANRMPAFEALGREGFRMEVQPCFDNFTTACVREMLTGRRVFSLFAVLENLQVTRPGVGDNIMSDARRAGLRTALLSWGDLRGWSKAVDTDHQLKSGQRDEEAAIGVELASSHDVVFHHWIWHDIASHHYAKHNGKKYAESLERTNALIESIAAELPSDMDLIVAGDHGHAPDGRHVQGMDLPTVLVARSPNLASMVVQERTPITATRFVIAAITGLGSHASTVQPEWQSWLSSRVGQTLRSMNTAPINATNTLQLPLGPMVAASGLAAIGCIALGWKLGVLFALWMAAAGFLFPEWLEFSHVRGFRKPIMLLAWSLPVAAAVVSLVRTRSLVHCWAAVARASLALGLVAWPGLFVTGVLRNTDAMLAPCIILAALIALGAHRENNTVPWARPSLVVIGMCAIGVALTFVITDFNTNHFRIRRFPALWAFKGQPEIRTAATVLLGIAVHRLLDSDRRWAAMGGLAVLSGPLLSAMGAALTMLLFTASWLSPNGVWRLRLLSITAIALTGHTLTSKRQLGVLLTVAGAGLAIQLLRRAAAASNPHPATLRISTAIVLIVTGFIGLAWTTKLQVSGVDFTFAVDWLPGRLHKDLWFIVAGATVLNCFLPLILTIENVRKNLPDVLHSAAEIAARFSVLRFTGTTVFATAWMIPMGDAAASSRLRSFLQDGFIWLILGTVLALWSWTRPGRGHPRDPAQTTEHRVS